MTVENARRRNSSASARKQTDKPSIGRNTHEVCAGVIKRLNHLSGELLGAIDDHRKWINSDRARTLGTAFEVSGRLFSYAVYIALAYLAFNSFVDIRNGLAAGVYTIPAQNDGSRVALFNLLAAGLVGPMAIIAIGFGLGWMYNLTTAAANRALPRFVQPLVHPSIMFAVAAALAAYHSAVTATAARGYLYAKANIEAASPQESVSIKVIEIPSRDISDTPEEAGRDSPSERELVRLKSIFNNSRPCSKDGHETELSPQPEVARPEPGLAPNRDCLLEKMTPHE